MSRNLLDGLEIKKGYIMRNKILIIEDDSVIQSELQTMLFTNGYEVFTVSDYYKIIDDIKDKSPDLILLDIKLPGKNGFSLCSEIRSFTEIPIIFVTSCNTDMDELNSIILGGDAYITKPYNVAILLAKIAFLLKKMRVQAEIENLSYNGVTLQLEKGKIEYNNKQVDLTKNEAKILYFLFKHAGAICLRTDLIDYLWDNQLYVDDNALSVNINRIREKLSDIGLNGFIKTKYRQGYMI